MNLSNLAASFWRGLRPALFVAAWTFASMFGLALIGWLDDVGAWLDSGAAHEFPDASVLVSAARSAMLAAASGLVAFAVRFTQSITGRGNVPSYDASAPTGEDYSGGLNN